MENNVVPSQDAMAEYNRIKRRNKKIGLAWLIVPFVSLFVVLTTYAIASFVIVQLTSSGAGTVGQLGTAGAGTTVLSIVRALLGLLGLVALICIAVGVPVGIIYLAKRVSVPGTVFDERSGKGDASVMPEEIKGWNWGAVGLPVIWGAAHRVWISFLCFIPLVGFIFRFFLGAYGNEWAWKAEKWESVEAFKKTQEKWKVWGILFFVLSILAILGQFTQSGR